MIYINIMYVCMYVKIRRHQYIIHVLCKKRNRSHTQTHNKNNTTHDTTRPTPRHDKNNTMYCVNMCEPKPKREWGHTHNSPARAVTQRPISHIAPIPPGTA